MLIKRTTISLIVISNLISFNFSANATALGEDVESFFSGNGRPADAYANNNVRPSDPLPPSTFAPPTPQNTENSINILPINELKPAGIGTL